MAVSKAHTKASKKYNAKTYKAFTVNAKIAEYNKIVDYCNNKGISKAQLLLRSAEYIINNNIDISDITTAPETSPEDREI